MVGLNLHPVPHLQHIHLREALNQLGHDSLVGRIEMGNDHKGHTGVGWHVAEELLECLQGTGRAAHSHDVKDLPFFFSRYRGFLL
ncbi:Uncharacterised protein [uncultured archaeon]|nr:Uncharacterised protein [uncultured archaeon]